MASVNSRLRSSTKRWGSLFEASHVILCFLQISFERAPSLVVLSIKPPLQLICLLFDCFSLDVDGVEGRLSDVIEPVARKPPAADARAQQAYAGQCRGARLRSVRTAAHTTLSDADQHIRKKRTTRPVRRQRGTWEARPDRVQATRSATKVRKGWNERTMQ